MLTNTGTVECILIEDLKLEVDSYEEDVSLEEKTMKLDISLYNHELDVARYQLIKTIEAVAEYKAKQQLIFLLKEYQSVKNEVLLFDENKNTLQNNLKIKKNSSKKLQKKKKY